MSTEIKLESIIFNTEYLQICIVKNIIDSKRQLVTVCEISNDVDKLIDYLYYLIQLNHEQGIIKIGTLIMRDNRLIVLHFLDENIKTLNSIVDFHSICPKEDVTEYFNSKSTKSDTNAIKNFKSLEIEMNDIELNKSLIKIVEKVQNLLKNYSKTINVYGSGLFDLFVNNTKIYVNSASLLYNHFFSENFEASGNILLNNNRSYSILQIRRWLTDSLFFRRRSSSSFNCFNESILKTNKYDFIIKLISQKKISDKIFVISSLKNLNYCDFKILINKYIEKVNSLPMPGDSEEENLKSGLDFEELNNEQKNNCSEEHDKNQKASVQPFLYCQSKSENSSPPSQLLEDDITHNLQSFNIHSFNEECNPKSNSKEKAEDNLHTENGKSIRRGRFIVEEAYNKNESNFLSTLQYRKGRFNVTEATTSEKTERGALKRITEIINIQNKQIDILFDMIKNISGGDKLFHHEFIALSNDAYELIEGLKKMTNK